MLDARTILLGDLGTFARGQGGTKKDARLSGVPCVRYGELYTAHDIRIRRFVSFVDPAVAARYTPLRSGDIVFAASGETHAEIGQGAVFLGSEPAVAGGDTLIFTPKPGADPVFLSYSANTAEAARLKARLGQGSSVIHIGAKHLQAVPVWLPPHPEQRQIAEILDNVDQSIRKTEEIIAKLEQVKQGLLHDLLTRGIDDNGELRDPDRHPFKSSSLGRIPKAWDVGPAAAWCDRLTVGVVNSATHAYVEEGVPFIRSQNVKPNRIVVDDVLHVTKAFNNQQSNSILRAGDVVIVRTGYPGTAAVVPRRLEGSNCFSLVIASPRAAELEPHFLAQYLNSPACKAEIRRMHFGSAQHNFNVGQIRRLAMPFPPIEEQRLIVHTISAHEARVELEEAQLAKLRVLRLGLMEDLLTGRVRARPFPKEAAE